MNRFSTYLRLWPVFLCLGIAAAVIGCGGGGGGSSTSGNQTNGNQTNGNQTNGNQTNGNSTSAGNAGTTPPAMGVLPANVILYADEVSNNNTNLFNIMQINPDGSKNLPFISGLQPPNTGAGSIEAIAANPNVKNQYVVGMTNANSLDGIYLATISTAGAISGQQTLVNPTYQVNTGLGVSEIVVTQDGSKALYIAADPTNQTTALYEATLSTTNQTPVLLDTNVASVSIGQDSDTIIYSKILNSSDTQLFRGNLSSNDANPVQITSDAASHDFPNIGRTGNFVVYSVLTDANVNQGNLNYGLAVLNIATANSTPVNLTANTSLDELVPCFSSDDSQVAFIGIGNSTGIYVMNVSGGTPEQNLVSDSGIFGATYWTSTNNRGIGGAGFNMGHPRKRKK